MQMTNGSLQFETMKIKNTKVDMVSSIFNNYITDPVYRSTFNYALANKDANLYLTAWGLAESFHHRAKVDNGIAENSRSSIAEFEDKRAVVVAEVLRLIPLITKKAVTLFPILATQPMIIDSELTKMYCMQGVGQAQPTLWHLFCILQAPAMPTNGRLIYPTLAAETAWYERDLATPWSEKLGVLHTYNFTGQIVINFTDTVTGKASSQEAKDEILKVMNLFRQSLKYDPHAGVVVGDPTLVSVL